METKRILVLGKTYPSYSDTYDELSCTGGLLEKSHEMVRLSPINFRDLPKDQQFAHWQWIEVDVEPHESDPRPESYRVKHGSIRLGSKMTKHALRRDALERSPHFCGSVEELQARQKKDRTSLGVIRPARLTGNRVVRRSGSERREWAAKEKAIFSQPRLFGEAPKRIDFPELKFHVVVGVQRVRLLRP